MKIPKNTSKIARLANFKRKKSQWPQNNGNMCQCCTFYKPKHRSKENTQKEPTKTMREKKT